MTSIKNIIYNILMKKNDFCCLCLDNIYENPIRLQDEVVIKQEDHKHEVAVSDVLVYVLGEEAYNMMSAFDFVCQQCINLAVNSYKFMISSKANSILLNNTVDSLMSCIEEISLEFLDSKTLFLLLNTTDFSCNPFYDNMIAKASALKILDKFKALISPKIINIKVSNVKKEDKGTKERKKMTAQNKQSVMKTEEMLVNQEDRTNIQCKECLKVYPTFSNLRNHYIRVHAPKNHICPTCNRKFGSEALLEAHKTQSHCTVVCSQCGKTFYNRHTLKMHEIGHSLKIVCPNCGRVYKNQTSYKKHLNLNVCPQPTRADPSDAKFTCDYCKKRYTQKVSLRVHIQYEHGNYKGHECKWCKKIFSCQSRLKAHIVKHTLEKKFSCDKCKGKFVTKESLLYHTRTHTGEKPYQCKYCDEKFVSPARRVDHVKRFHVNKTLQCDICKDSFLTESCLMRHKKKHIDDDLKDSSIELLQDTQTLGEHVLVVEL